MWKRIQRRATTKGMEGARRTKAEEREGKRHSVHGTYPAYRRRALDEMIYSSRARASIHERPPK